MYRYLLLSLLAVSVHQITPTSGDVIFGTTLHVDYLFLPSFLAQPTSQTALECDRVSLEAMATGVPPPEYQWYRDDVAISGATALSYRIPSTQSFHAGSYKVQVSNTDGSVMSNA